MPKTIGIIQVKGGAGRSTVSTNLAGELSKLGKTVLIGLRHATRHGSKLVFSSATDRGNTGSVVQ